MFLIGEDRDIRPAPVRLTAQDPELELPQFISSYWDKKTRRLHSFGRGRAFADCGQEQAFAWDGDQSSWLKRPTWASASIISPSTVAKRPCARGAAECTSTPLRRDAPQSQG